MVNFSGEWLRVADIVVSAILSGSLVILYFMQTRILKSQRELLTQELNREVRQQHTETLRDRVRTWHGNPDREIGETPIDGPEMNLPSVRGASFETASSWGYGSGRDEERLEVVPKRLQGDRYLQDLLENHAPDLCEAKEEIEESYNQFVSLRKEFRDAYDDSIVLETEEYTLEPASSFDQWIFELLVLLNRGKLDSFDDLRDKAISRIEQGNSSARSDEPMIWIRTAQGGGKSYAIYSASLETDDREKLQEIRPEAEEQTKDLVEQILDNIEEEYPYSLAQEAGAILDEAEGSIVELERILMEYEGRPVYPGDCKYLQEAEI